MTVLEMYNTLVNKVKGDNIHFKILKWGGKVIWTHIEPSGTSRFLLISETRKGITYTVPVKTHEEVEIVKQQ